MSKRTLEQFADAKDQARFEENQELARAARTLRSVIRDRDEELRDLRRRLGLIAAVDNANVSPPKWLVPKARKGAKHLAIPSMMLTDIHWAARIDAAELGGLNKYNREIARQRVRRAAEGAIHLTHTYLSGVEYEGFNLMLGGDLLSGDIHDELRETNDGTVPEVILEAVEHLVAAGKLLAEAFGKLHVECVVGNHGRRTRKPRSKRKARDNYDWLIYKFVARELSADPRITMNVTDAPDAYFSVYETRYCLTHGDQFRGGSGISGFLTPLMLGVHRKRRKDAQAGRYWDKIVLGHFHQSYFLKEIIVGGSVCGYDEYASDNNYAPEPAEAALWLNTPERGVTGYMPVHLEDREAEGW